MELYRLKIVLLLTIGFVLASLLGYITQKIRLSPLLGYLIGGYLIGPYSPGFEADLEVSEQLAEIGVILMMFGVGLHFKWEELMLVKKIAIPGAIIQTLVTAIVCTLLMTYFGWPLESGIIIGIAIGVASTVVLVRVLTDNNLLSTPQGHVAVGWLIVEDILTVAALILLPLGMEATHTNSLTGGDVVTSLGIIILKFLMLGLLVFTLGRKIVTFILNNVARTRSHELFTITVLALTFAVAVGSTLIFGTSIALGAFLAGMVIGRTDLRHQALANSLALKDVFVVIFFLSIGMLFNPQIIVDDFPLFVGILAIIVLIKPLVAYIIVLVMKYPVKTALTVALALGQIGEFSFILAEESSRLKILSDDGYDLIVACALASIALNPIAFRYIDSLCSLMESNDLVRTESPLAGLFWNNPPKAIVVGFSSVGQAAWRTLEKLGMATLVIERNVDIVARLNRDAIHAIYGDAAHEEILLVAHVESAALVAIAIPDADIALNVIQTVRRLNPLIQILAVAKDKSEEHIFKDLGVNTVTEEVEVIKAYNHAIFKLSDSYTRGYHHKNI